MKQHLLTLCSLPLLLLDFIYAGDHVESQTLMSPAKAKAIHSIYQTMSTAQLQQEAEKLSQHGHVSLILGQELMKRWTKSKT